MNESLKTMLNENDGCVKSFVCFDLTVLLLSLSVASAFQTSESLSFTFNSMNGQRARRTRRQRSRSNFGRPQFPRGVVFDKWQANREATTCDNGLPWATTILMTIRIGDL